MSTTKKLTRRDVQTLAMRREPFVLRFGGQEWGIERILRYTWGNSGTGLVECQTDNGYYAFPFSLCRIRKGTAS